MEKTDLNIAETLKLIETNEEFASELASTIEESVAVHKERLAYVVSATGFSEEEMTLLKDRLNKILNKDLFFDFRIDPRLLGGFRITVGDWKLDATLATRLQQMKELVLENL